MTNLRTKRPHCRKTAPKFRLRMQRGMRFARPHSFQSSSAQSLEGTAFGRLLGSSAGTGFLGCCKSGIKSFEAPPGKRSTLGYLIIVLSKSSSTAEKSAADQPLSSPAYLPGEVFRLFISPSAPLKIMSYLSNGSMVRLYTAGMEPRPWLGPSHESFAVQMNFQAMLSHGSLGSPAISTRMALRYSPLMKTHDRRAECCALPRM